MRRHGRRSSAFVTLELFSVLLPKLVNFLASQLFENVLIVVMLQRSVQTRYEFFIVGLRYPAKKIGGFPAASQS